MTDPQDGTELSTKARRKLAAREAAAAKVAAVRDWHEGRRVAARERAAQRTKAKAAAKGLGHTGADRVPGRLRVERTKPLPDPVVAELGTYRGVSAPYRERRAMGQRGHKAKTRTRDLPGAVERRIERNRRAWVS